jgi:protein-disulfide isomerase
MKSTSSIGDISPEKLTLPDVRRDHIQGSPNAVIMLLEYGDYECPFCGQAYVLIKKIQESLGDDLCFAFRNFPLANMHPHAEHAAEAAEAAALKGKFWEMHDLLYENQDALDDESLAEYIAELNFDAPRLIEEVVAGAHAERIREDFKSGVRAGVNGTPSFFINGLRYDGALDFDTLLAILSEGVTG